MYGYVVSNNLLVNFILIENLGGINNDVLIDEFIVIDVSYGFDYDDC